MSFWTVMPTGVLWRFVRWRTDRDAPDRKLSADWKAPGQVLFKETPVKVHGLH